MDFFSPDFSGEQKREIESLVDQLESGRPEISLFLVLDLQGRVIASSRSKDADEVELLRRCVFEIFTRSEAIAQQMGHERVEQIVATTSEGFTFTVAGFGSGVIATLTKNSITAFDA